MLYELLTGELSEDAVCLTYKELLQGSDINFVQDKVVAVNLQEKRLKLASGSDYIYDHLVLAVGTIQGYLGTEGAQKNAFFGHKRTRSLWNTSYENVCNVLAKRMTKHNGDRSSPYGYGESDRLTVDRSFI